MFFWLQIKWLTVQLALVTTRHVVRRAISQGKNYVRSKAVKSAKKVTVARRKTGRAAKDLILPKLPGVSKVRLPEPPIPELLHSNLPPTEEEVVLITKAIMKAEEEQMRLQQVFDDRIKAGNTTRAWETVTRHKIGQAKRFTQRHRALISPIRRLPPEILQEIFSWIAPSFQQVHARWRWNSDLPWGLGQICQTWRYSILCMPSFWGHLPTIQLKKSSSKTRLQVEYLTELIQRSRGAPLNMYIYSRSFERNKHPVIDLLCRHAERWEVVTMELAPVTIAGFQSIKGRLDSLKNLTLQAHLTRQEIQPLDIFESAPKLQTVSVTGPLFGDVLLPFTQLVHYKERLIWGNRINQVITSAMLETLTVLELSDEVVFPPMTIPKLKKLQVKFQYRPQRNCFDHLVVPCLEDIRIVSYRGNLMASLTLMVSRSGSPSPLKNICIRSEFIGHNEMTNLLALTPFLTTLDITLPSSNSDIYKLANGYQNRPLAPLLETVNFYLEDIVGHDVSRALNKVALRRCELIHDASADLVLSGEMRPIKELTIYFDGSEWAHMQQASLENWAATETSDQLTSIRKQLYERMPELQYGRPGKQRIFDLKLNDKIPGLLASVDNIKVESVDDIYLSRIQYLLKTLSESKIPAYADRARSILAKWQLMFEESVHSRHWAFKGPYSMAYISDDDALRRTADGSMSILFGLKEQTPFSAAFWPMFMSR